MRALLLGLIVGVSVLAEEPEPAPPAFPPRPHGEIDPSADGVARQIARLGSENQADRDDAAVRLFWCGEGAREALKAALANPDAEVAHRAKQVLALLDARAALKPVNVRFKVRGYCHAGSETEDDEALGDFWKSPNLPVPVPEGTADRLSLLVDRDSLVVFGRKYLGVRVTLANGTAKEVAIEASDSRIGLVQEAKDEEGEWKPIEYLPQSW